MHGAGIPVQQENELLTPWIAWHRLSGKCLARLRRQEYVASPDIVRNVMFHMLGANTERPHVFDIRMAPGLFSAMYELLAAFVYVMLTIPVPYFLYISLTVHLTDAPRSVLFTHTVWYSNHIYVYVFVGQICALCITGVRECHDCLRCMIVLLKCHHVLHGIPKVSHSQGLMCAFCTKRVSTQASSAHGHMTRTLHWSIMSWNPHTLWRRFLCSECELALVANMSCWAL